MAPAGWRRPVAAAAVVAVTAVSYRGVSRPARLARVVVTVVLLGLAAVVVAGLSAGGADLSRAAFWDGGPTSPAGVLQSAGLLFFAFAGYARVATLGEEVRDPVRTIPRAITVALAITVVLYAAVGLTVLTVLGPDGAARSPAPLADVAAATGLAWLPAVVAVAAAAASLGALLALLAGVARTALAMARAGDLPGWLAAVHPRFAVPHRAEVVVGGVVVALVLAVDLRGAIGFSSLGVLVYYLVANLAARTQSGVPRRYPRARQWFGAAACAVLALTLPWGAVLGGAAVLALGLVVRAARLRRG
mgnify:FL=1